MTANVGSRLAGLVGVGGWTDTVDKATKAHYLDGSAARRTGPDPRLHGPAVILDLPVPVLPRVPGEGTPRRRRRPVRGLLSAVPWGAGGGGVVSFERGVKLRGLWVRTVHSVLSLGDDPPPGCPGLRLPCLGVCVAAALGGCVC